MSDKARWGDRTPLFLKIMSDPIWSSVSNSSVRVHFRGLVRHTSAYILSEQGFAKMHLIRAIVYCNVIAATYGYSGEEFFDKVNEAALDYKENYTTPSERSEWELTVISALGVISNSILESNRDFAMGSLASFSAIAILRIESL